MREKFRFKKEMGQNFIFDRDVIDCLADASGVTREDGVLEIGPGRGTLTAALAMRARRVIAVELDRTLIRTLEAEMSLYPNVEIVQGDILRADITGIVKELGTPCRVAANLPYNITTPLLEMLLLSRLPFASIAVMLQKEVGDRMCAGVGDDGYGPFSLMVQYFAEPKEAVFVPAAYFTPQPKVDSSFMMLTMREQPPVDVPDADAFLRLIKRSFAMRRKTIQNNLMAGGAMMKEDVLTVLEAAEIAPNERAERIDMEGFARMARAMANLKT